MNSRQSRSDMPSQSKTSEDTVSFPVATPVWTSSAAAVVPPMKPRLPKTISAPRPRMTTTTVQLRGGAAWSRQLGKVGVLGHIAQEPTNRNTKQQPGAPAPAGWARRLGCPAKGAGRVARAVPLQLGGGMAVSTAAFNEGRVPQRGRPRDASRDDALRQAALEVMAEVGYRALTMDAVAARARAGKATIYRRWESKLDLVIDTCTQLATQNLAAPDTGSLAGDLREFL